MYHTDNERTTTNDESQTMCTFRGRVFENRIWKSDGRGWDTDCTITKTIGFYKGQRENSLKVDIYDIAVDSAVDMASYFARIFQQECVALTVDGKTHFITGTLTEDEFNIIIDELEK